MQHEDIEQVEGAGKRLLDDHRVMILRWEMDVLVSAAWQACIVHIALFALKPAFVHVVSGASGEGFTVACWRRTA